MRAHSCRFVRRYARPIVDDMISQFLVEVGDDGTLGAVVQKLKKDPSRLATRLAAGVFVHKTAQVAHFLLDHMVHKL